MDTTLVEVNTKIDIDTPIGLADHIVADINTFLKNILPNLVFFG